MREEVEGVSERKQPRRGRAAKKAEVAREPESKTAKLKEPEGQFDPQDDLAIVRIVASGLGAARLPRATGELDGLQPNVHEAPAAEDLARAARIVIRGREARPSTSAEPHPASTLDVPGAVHRLRSAFDRVRSQIIGRDDLITQTLYALLTREHQLIFSRAGTAKSLYASAIFSQIKDARAFSMQLTKGTTEEGLVGAVNIEELKKGNVIHNVEGSIVDSRLAFLDEIFDANDVALRSLLGILNERSFRKGKQSVEAEMHSAIATSNYVRSTDVTEAVIDRFAYRALLSPESDHYDRLRIDGAYEKHLGRVHRADESEKIPFAELDQLADIVEGRVECKAIRAAPSILYLKNALIEEFVRVVNEERKKGAKPELYISPRTIAKSRDCLNASALLDGRTEVAAKDVPNLRYMITTIGDAEQEGAFVKAMQNLKRRISKRDLEAVDALMDTHRLLDGVLESLERGGTIEQSMWDRIRVAFRITSPAELTFGRIKKTVAAVESENGDVQQIREALLRRITVERDRLLSRQPQQPVH